MKRRMTDTQLESWAKCQAGLPEKRQAVLREIRRWEKATEFQVAEALGVPVHYISGTITKLRDDGYLVDSKERAINPASGRHVTLWTTPDDPPAGQVKPDRIKCPSCRGKGFIEQGRLL